MKLKAIRLSNFQSFGEKPTKISLRDITYLIGPNGSGKTAVLQALYRMFGFDPSLRRVVRSDFHVPRDEKVVPEERRFWIEIDFVFPELMEDEDNPAVPVFFSHMRLATTKGIPRVRYRLSATMTADGEIEDTLVYVLEVDADDAPVETTSVPKAERNQVQAHYLPARRNPADHIAYGTSALLGRLLRSINWSGERENIKRLTDQISESLAVNPSISAFSENLKAVWSTLHKGSFFADPKVTFIASEIESLLRHTSISFSPGHESDIIDYSRLSDGQKSMLYLSLVLSSQAIGQAVLEGREESFDRDRLRPPVFTLVAIEEPENSLSPHYLGRIVTALGEMTRAGNAQALIATHAPSMLKRVDPEHIRYLRLRENRTTRVTRIRLSTDILSIPESF